MVSIEHQVVYFMSFLSRLLTSKKKKQQIKKLKYNLNIIQDSDTVIFQGEFSKEYYKAWELWMYSRNTDTKLKLSEIQPSSTFAFNVNLKEVLKKVENFDTETFDLFLKVSTITDTLKEKKLIELQESDAEFFLDEENNSMVKYDIRLGRFQHTTVRGLEKYIYNDNFSFFYITKKGNISFCYNCEPESPIKNQIEKVKSTKNTLKLSGRVFTYNSIIKSGTIYLKGRDTESEYEVPIDVTHLSEETGAKYGLNRYIYSSDIEISSLNNGLIPEEDIYDLYLKLTLHDNSNEKIVRIGKPTFSAEFFTKELHAINEENVAIITPYYTFKRKNLSLELFSFTRENFHYLKKVIRWAWLIRPLNRNKNVWLVGERIYKAQDTGYHFFKYMREKHPNKNVYYVMDTNSREYKNVEALGNILDFKSKEHIWNTVISTRIISSHHADYLYPIRTKRFKKAVKATKVFLQHGVMGTKNMIANYGKNAFGFDTDLFLVSSDFEKNMIVKDFGYSPNEVFITGLSRFDELFNQNIKLKRQLLIIPTWRDWIGSKDIFTETEYFQRYHEIIFSERLHNMANHYNFDIVFCLHPNMQKYTPYFKEAPVKVISQGEVDVQSLLKESAMMLTDYSSVAFDFSFLHKPIIYYQFDRDRFIGKHPSHLDLDNDLPGDIVFEKDSLLDCIEYYAQNNFKAKKANIVRSNKFLKYHDQHSNDRIYEVIQQHSKVKVPRVKKLMENKFFKEIFKRFRKSKYYFPVMKLCYNFARNMLKKDNQMILFESSVGKQYADSPKYIYEEILRRNLPYKKVWVCNSNQTRFPDPDTIKIKRLSPQYYYYLAKAKFWVNNQNFPTYIKKPKTTIYLQTWHGTPLKKMLYDIENIQGRDEGYLERVSSATKDWNYLISPSPYATSAFKSAFRYQGEILEHGYPRNDIFYNENVKEISSQVKKRLKLPTNKKVILYAPTFRDNQKVNNKFVFSLNMDFDKLYEQLGEEYILLLRLHVIVKNKVHIPEEYRDFIYNVSNYPDIQELYLISDILITDYSSVMFDFANTGRPILFYTYDLEDYRDNLRGFYMDLEKEAPGPLLKTTEDIIESVLKIDHVANEYNQKYHAFKEKFCGLEDGHATERVVTQIFEK